jgi:tetratricopeptide (TPR) repeat protein
MIKLLLLLLPATAMATNLGAITPNNRAVKEIQENNQYKAYQSLVEAAAADSFDPAVRLNLGYVYLKNEEADKAAQEFSLAKQFAGDNKDLNFMANFNLGVALAAKGDIPGALAAYQEALEWEPGSKEVKTNIELLWNQQNGAKGGGKSDQKQKGSESDKSEGDKPNDQKNDNQQTGGNENKEQPKPQPKPFESQELTPETVRKVLEELKAQEQRVRADHYSKGAKERPRDKDW